MLRKMFGGLALASVMMIGCGPKAAEKKAEPAPAAAPSEPAPAAPADAAAPAAPVEEKK